MLIQNLYVNQCQVIKAAERRQFRIRLITGLALIAAGVGVIVMLKPLVFALSAGLVLCAAGVIVARRAEKALLALRTIAINPKWNPPEEDSLG